MKPEDQIDSLNANVGQAWSPASITDGIRKRVEGPFPWPIIFLLGLVGAAMVALILLLLRYFDWWVLQVGDGFALDLVIVSSVWVLSTSALGVWRRARRSSGNREDQP
jgi:hypothetical protein